MQDDTSDLIAQLTYVVDLRVPATTETIDHVANGVINERGYAQPPSKYLAAIHDALRETGPIARWDQNEHHLRSYLDQLGQRLEAARPWPEPGFRSIPVEERPELLTAPVVLRIPESERKVSTILNKMFARRGLDQAALVLALAGGVEIALTAPANPSTDPVEVHARGISSADLQQLLRRTTGLASEPA